MTKPGIQAVVISLSLLFCLSLFVNGQARTLPSTCSPSSCGNLRNISYPFRLKGDPSSCGDPDYELDCQENKTVLSINAANYYVKEISYGRQSIQVADVRLASNESCSLPQRYLSRDELGDDRRFDIPIIPSWATFVNCSGSVNDDLTYVSVPCLSGKGAYVYVVYPSHEPSEIKESCEMISMIPSRFADVRNRSFDAVERILEMGFELDWSVGCRDCRSSGGSCDAFTYDITGCRQSLTKGLFKSAISRDIVCILIERYVVAPIFIFALLFCKYRKTHLSIDNIKSTLGIPHKSPSIHRPPVSEAVEMKGNRMVYVAKPTESCSG